LRAGLPDVRYGTDEEETDKEEEDMRMPKEEKAIGLLFPGKIMKRLFRS
jgi:hypothetical protein